MKQFRFENPWREQRVLKFEEKWSTASDFLPLARAEASNNLKVLADVFAKFRVLRDEIDIVDVGDEIDRLCESGEIEEKIPEVASFFAEYFADAAGKGLEEIDPWYVFAKARRPAYDTEVPRFFFFDAWWNPDSWK